MIPAYIPPVDMADIYPEYRQVQVAPAFLQGADDPCTIIYDLLSSNGSRLNLKPVQDVWLVDGMLIRNLSREVSDRDVSRVHSASVSERLDQIKDSLALSVTQMAELFGVTRKTIYDWYEGAEPRSTTMSRIEVLADVLREASAQIDIKRLKTVWSVPISGRSFHSIFNDDSMNLAVFRKALVAKLDELNTRMVAQTVAVHRSTAKIGSAHLAEFERGIDIG